MTGGVPREWLSLAHLCFFLVCVCAQLHLTVCKPRDCSPPGFSVHGNFQARIVE